MSHLLFPSFQLSFRITSLATSQRQCVRAVATTAKLKHFHPFREITPLKELWGEKDDPSNPMPKYPYAPNHNYPEADTGLYGGSTVQSGNKVSKGRNKGKTLRRWYPNVRLETLRSEALDTEFAMKVTAQCKRTIDKCGGLDQYLLGSTAARIKQLGLIGWRLRWRVLTSPKMSKEFNAERRRLGLPDTDPLKETFEEAWEKPEVRERILELQTKAWDRLREKNERFQKHMKRITPTKYMRPGRGLRLKQPVLMELSPRKLLSMA